MIKGAAELYRTYPGTRLEADGKYHINNTSWAETYRDGVRDGINDLASVRGIFPVAIKAAKLLKVDADLVPLWQDMLDKLAPYPTNSTPNAMGVLQIAGEPVYAIGIGDGNFPGSDARPADDDGQHLRSGEHGIEADQTRRMANGDEHAGRP